eukprot:scaffold66377_cov27-Prasinocladus_malaysianus.AAC.1
MHAEVLSTLRPIRNITLLRRNIVRAIRTNTHLCRTVTHVDDLKPRILQPYPYEYEYGSLRLAGSVRAARDSISAVGTHE